MVGANVGWIVTSVYGPNDSGTRHLFWDELDSIRRWNGAWCIGGDRNVIRFPSKRSGGTFFSVEMIEFSDWIIQNSLVDLQLGGAQYTWSNHQEYPTLSRLDRFLVCRDWIQLVPETCQLALPKPMSNHCPIKLDTICERWEPSPFCFQLMSLEEKDRGG